MIVITKDKAEKFNPEKSEKASKSEKKMSEKADK